MPKLTDTQLVILSAAAQREDLAVLPLPKSLKVNKGAATSVLKSLIKRCLIEEQAAKVGAEVWREDQIGARHALAVTTAGLEAIGVETPNAASASKAKTKPRASGGKTDGSSADLCVRPGTKQALLIELLKRGNGATIDEAVEATGWQPHSVRGAISGTLKKKLGLFVTSEKVEGRGRVYRIAAHG